MPSLSRRAFLGSSAAAALATHPLLAAGTGNNVLALIGTQTAPPTDTTPGTSKGIYAYSFNTLTGELTRTALAAATPSPTFLVASPDRRTIFAVNETDSFDAQHAGAISSFTLDAATGRLTPISQVSSQGADPCHIAVDPTGTNVFAANYAGGSAISFHLAGGDHLGKPASFLQYTGHGPDASRQQAPHAHRTTVSPDNQYVLVNDLGLDKIHIYQLDAATGRLSPNGTDWEAPAGSGPRALVFHPNGKFAYCVCEMASKVIVLAWDAQAGTLTTKQEFALPVDPALIPKGGASTGCEIVLDRQARFAYVANRGDDFLATFALTPDGSRLTYHRRSSAGGTVPRHIALDPTGHWLLVANQGSSNVAVFARDPQSGYLAETSKSFPLSKPQCIVFPL